MNLQPSLLPTILLSHIGATTLLIPNRWFVTVIIGFIRYIWSLATRLELTLLIVRRLSRISVDLSDATSEYWCVFWQAPPVILMPDFEENTKLSLAATGRQVSLLRVAANLHGLRTVSDDESTCRTNSQVRVLDHSLTYPLSSASWYISIFNDGLSNPCQSYAHSAQSCNWNEWAAGDYQCTADRTDAMNASGLAKTQTECQSARRLHGGNACNVSISVPLLRRLQHVLRWIASLSVSNV
jgi:hypothetical protein